MTTSQNDLTPQGPIFDFSARADFLRTERDVFARMIARAAVKGDQSSVSYWVPKFAHADAQCEAHYDDPRWLRNDHLSVQIAP